MKTQAKVLLRLFWEFFAISLLVTGGGYAILAVAEQVFCRRLKWLKEGELTEKLPVFQMVPGLIAGNTAIYTGRRLAGRLGAAVALLGVALPSFLVFLAVTMGFGALPKSSPVIDGLFLGLRAALTGIIGAMLMKSWRRTVKDVFGVVVAIVAIALLIPLKVNPFWVIVAAMIAGICRQLSARSGGLAAPGLTATESAVKPGGFGQWLTAAGIVAFLATGLIFYRPILLTFLKFGSVAFGGGFVLVPMYVNEFVGASAALLQLPAEEFSNLIALTQATPGPVSVNAATFFGFRLGGVAGAAVATAALLLPSFILLPMVLSGLEKGRENRLVQGLLFGVRPATNALLASALVIFVRLSVWPESGFSFLAFALALFAAERTLRGRQSVVALIAICALVALVAKLLTIG